MQNPADYDRLSYDPLFYFKEHPAQVVIDEGQEYPELFRILRGVVDEQRDQKGRFLLTGSSSPELLRPISESLAGRIGILELGTLKANEYHGLPLSPFYQLFEGKLSPERAPEGKPPLTSAQMKKLWLEGGTPWRPITEAPRPIYEFGGPFANPLPGKGKTFNVQHECSMFKFGTGNPAYSGQRASSIINRVIISVVRPHSSRALPHSASEKQPVSTSILYMERP